MARDSGMVDLARSPEEMKRDLAGYGMPSSTAERLSNEPVYPYGTCISFGDDELDKLNLDCDCEPGDQMIGRFVAEVKDVSQTKMGDGAVRRRIELQITKISVVDPESAAGAIDDKDRKSTRYKAGDDED